MSIQRRVRDEEGRADTVASTTLQFIRTTYMGSIDFIRRPYKESH